MIKLTGIFFIISIYCIKLDAQCGTSVDAAQIAFEAGISDSLNALVELNRTLNVTVYITKNDQGITGVDLPDLNQAFQEVNVAFDPVKIKFNINSVIIIDNYTLDSIKQSASEEDIIIRNYTANTINLYLVGFLRDKNNIDVCGYTYFPSASRDVLFIRKDCLSGRFIIEQLGHFLNLYHTHETAFGMERVNESNCATAGDLCCDTYADPDLTDKVLSGCIYSSQAKDPNNFFYAPSVNNYMSYTRPECKCFFSEQQYIRMLNTLVLFKSHLW
jgi:hypothetical protein